MISLIEADDDQPGNLDQLRKDLSEAVRSNAPAPGDRQAQPKQGAGEQAHSTTANEPEDEDAKLPERMRGKSKSEIAEMYANLESRYGSMANDLGVQRKLTDRLLDLKRESDLQANSNTPAVPKLTAAEILDNPTEAIERIVQARLAAVEKENRERLAAVEAQTAAQQFNARHSDWQQIAADPEFHEFVRGTHYRQRTASAAANGDWAAADELVTEFKDRRKLRAAPRNKDEGTESQSGVEAARKAGLESATAGGQNSRKAGKVYRRADLLKLQLEDREAYYDEEFQKEIMRAYAEGRVR